jgi:hypothetical protein
MTELENESPWHIAEPPSVSRLYTTWANLDVSQACGVSTVYEMDGFFSETHAVDVIKHLKLCGNYLRHMN